MILRTIHAVETFDLIAVCGDIAFGVGIAILQSAVRIVPVAGSAAIADAVIAPTADILRGAASIGSHVTFTDIEEWCAEIAGVEIDGADLRVAAIDDRDGLTARVCDDQ